MMPTATSTSRAEIVRLSHRIAYRVSAVLDASPSAGRGNSTDVQPGRQRTRADRRSHDLLMDPRQHEPVRVLVVDDEPQLRRDPERALKLGGYEGRLAADGQEALGSVGSQPTDAIVLDVLMPKRDGLE